MKCPNCGFDCEGTVTTFCEENNISKTQFYYHKRRIEAASTEGTPIFQSISLNEEAVSYTHLDVYKRQTILNDLAASFEGRNEYISRLCSYPLPVSYTHLDVYKRQSKDYSIQ